MAAARCPHVFVKAALRDDRIGHCLRRAPRGAQEREGVLSAATRRSIEPGDVREGPGKRHHHEPCPAEQCAAQTGPDAIGGEAGCERTEGARTDGAQGIHGKQPCAVRRGAACCTNVRLVLTNSAPQAPQANTLRAMLPLPFA